MKKVPVLDIMQFAEQDSVENFYANTLQDHLITRHKNINHPHSHNFYLAILFTKGSGIHEVDFNTYKVMPGAIFFLNPGQTHNWQLSADTEGYIFFHTREFYEIQYTHNRLGQFPFYYSIHNLPLLYLEGDEVATIVQLFKNIFDENHTVNHFKNNILVSLVDLVYTYSTRLYIKENKFTTASNNAYYDKFRTFEMLVERQFRTEKSPANYAAQLAITPRHLNRVTQAVAGKTATDVVLDRVLLEAKKEMVLRQDSFANIASGLGYDDYAYFSRLFKSRTKQTPSEFLTKYRHD